MEAILLRARGAPDRWAPHRRLLRFAVALTFAIAASALVPAASLGDQHRPGLGPGCAPDRPAVPHYADEVIATGHQGPAPIPCVTATGLRTSEMSIGVTNHGALLVPPAIPAGSLDQHLDGIAGTPVGVARSTDHGASWSYINPMTGPPRKTGVDMNLTVDRATDRVFWSSDIVNLGLLEVGGVNLGWVGPTLAEAPPRLDISDTGGRTWYSSATLPILFDHTQVFTGPPTAPLRGLMQGAYPDVVYVVGADGGLYCTQFHFTCGPHITKSVDGGLTFEPSAAIPGPPGCPAPGNPPGGYGLHGVVGRDGTVYLPLVQCNKPDVAISHDEGATWTVVQVANVTPAGAGELALGLDPRGNLYASWVSSADHLPYMAISRDGGLHWSDPLMIAAPGVTEAAEPQLTAGPHGQVTVSYYASTNTPGDQKTTWNTYATETFNPLSHRPLFWSATLNAPSQPTWYGASITNAGAPVGSSEFGQMDYFGMTTGPDGTPWVAFDQECPKGLPVPGNPNCPSTLTGAANDGLFALVGRLVSTRK